MLIIAEIGQNHNGDMKLAEELIIAAKSSGADIAKFQLYDTAKIFKADFKWYREAKAAQLTSGQAEHLSNFCARVDIEFMASVFDLERFRWCEALGVKRYKVASRSVHNELLIESMVDTGKPMIISLGMWEGKNFPDIPGANFLYCVSKYPASHQDLNLKAVDFTRYSGFSDHSLGISAALVAAARGASIIEKHFTLDRKAHGPDHCLSAEPKELAALSRYARYFEEVIK